MVGSLSVSPCLMEDNLSLGCFLFHIGNQFVEIGLICVVDSREMACLLYAHIVPVFLAQGFAHLLVGCLHHLAVYSCLSVSICLQVAFYALHVSFERASGDI